MRLSAARVSRLLLASALLASVASAQDETRQVNGLTASVEVLTDRWGLDHIYADSEDDLFFVQGYRAAESRLFQFEMWRRQATGTVAAILGPSELQRDIGTRLHMFRKDMGEEMRWYHPRGDKIIVYKMKRRKGYRRKQGHRQGYTEIRILGIDLPDGPQEAVAKPAAAAPKAKAAPKPKAAPEAEAAPEPEAAESAPVDITPVARKLAEEHGLDLGAIEGTGKDGRILKSDVDKAIAAKEGD